MPSQLVGGRIAVRSVYRRGRVFHVRFLDRHGEINGGRIWTCSTGERSKVRAQRVAVEIAEAELEALRGGATGDLTFEGASKRWLAEQAEISDATRDEYEATMVQLVRAFGPKPIAELKRADVVTWRNARLAEVAPRTVQKAMWHLRSICAWARVEGYLDGDPCELVKVKGGKVRTRRQLTTEELRALLAACEPLPHLWRAVLIGAHTGIRPGNVRGLRWDWVDLDARMIRIPKASVKNRRTMDAEFYRVAIHQELLPILAELDRDSPYVLGREYRSLRTIFQDAVKRAAVGHVTPNDLRHTFFTTAQTTLGDWGTAETLVGHKVQATGGHYWHPPDSFFVDAIDRMPWILRDGEEPSLAPP